MSSCFPAFFRRETMSHRRVSVGVLLPVFVVAACGCGSQGPVHVTGTVTSNGVAVPNLVVHFTPAEGKPSWGFTDDKGFYTLKIDKQTEGALRGEHKVHVEFRPRNPQEENDFNTGKLKLPGNMKNILTKYGNATTSPLRFEVKQENQVIDIPLD
jgi:hypothetical protein